MTDTVTVSVEIPVDDLRDFHRERGDAQWQATFTDWSTSWLLGARMDGHFRLACLDTALPPEPIKVGDRVKSGRYVGEVVALHKTNAWVDIGRDGPFTFTTAGLTRVEDQ